MNQKYPSLYTKIFLILIFLNPLIYKSQDFNFSQYNENPSLINPALVGSRDAMRASLVYRDQWRSVTTPFTTYGASFETKFKPSNWEQADDYRQKIYKRSINKASGGISFFNDKAGDGRLSTTNVNLSLSSFVNLAKFNKLAFGLQGSFTQKRVDNSQLIYPNQFNGTTYDPGIPSNEAYSAQRVSYPDLGAGFAWCYDKKGTTFTANSQKFASLGFSIFHINRPNQNFINGTGDRMAMKYVIHGNFITASEESKIGFEPSFLVQLQGPNTEIIAGTIIRRFLNIDSRYTGYNRRSSVGFGVFYRNRDALTTNLLIEYKAYAIGFSYDINVSKLKTVSSYNGAMEITLRYTNSATFLYQKRR